MGDFARSQNLAWDHVVSSPAVRCTETLDGFWDGYGCILHPNWDRRIYLASGVTLLDVVHDMDDADGAVLMCGHNPGLEDLALMLVPDSKGDLLRDELEEKLPTAALVELAFETDHWRDVKEGSARLMRFTRPRDLDSSLGPDLDT